MGTISTPVGRLTKRRSKVTRNVSQFLRIVRSSTHKTRVRKEYLKQGGEWSQDLTKENKAILWSAISRVLERMEGRMADNQVANYPDAFDELRAVSCWLEDDIMSRE